MYFFPFPVKYLYFFFVVFLCCVRLYSTLFFSLSPRPRRLPHLCSLCYIALVLSSQRLSPPSILLYSVRFPSSFLSVFLLFLCVSIRVHTSLEFMYVFVFLFNLSIVKTYYSLSLSLFCFSLHISIYIYLFIYLSIYLSIFLSLSSMSSSFPLYFSFVPLPPRGLNLAHVASCPSGG